MARPRTQQLTIYLLKPNITTPLQSIRTGATCTPINSAITVTGIEAIYQSPSHLNPPAWLRYFPSQTQGSFGNSRTASAGAVIFVSARGRFFAICFGTGWHILKKDAFVRSFGMRAALRLVKKETIRSADISTYENFAKYKRVSTSKGTELSTFDIEGQLDLLRGVVGECERSRIGSQIGGKDPCVIWTKLPFDKLPQLCEILLGASESDLIERRYPVIKNIALVRDPTELTRLDTLLENALPQLAAHLHMAPPDVVNWEEVNAFKLLHQNAQTPGIQLSFGLVLPLFHPSTPTIAQLKELEVETVRPDGSPGSQRWTIYDCVIAELNDPLNQAKRCLLMAGEWYSVDAIFSSEVNTYLGQIPTHNSRQLPSAQIGEVENIYNDRFARSDQANLHKLDAKNISYGGGRSRIEVCDVLSAQGKLYHIKDYNGSATLSHLFAQGTVSARLILDPNFRAAIAAKFGTPVGTILPTAGINPSQLEVIYGVICEQGRSIPADLPFFAKVRLMESTKELHRMGFTNVSTIGIPRN